MLTLLLKTLGWLLARTPEPLLCVLAAGLGDFFFYGLPRRRRVVLSNLHHAFPEKPASWHRAIGRASCRRIVETGLLSLASPYLSDARLRRIVTVSPAMLTTFAEHRATPAATLICSPHIAYWEVQTALPLFVPGAFPEFGIIFRPLNNPSANAFVQRTRERFGMKLLSRKEGFAGALKILRRQGFVGVLFDQNAGQQGALTTLFGRVCATTELPGLMAEKFEARVVVIFPRRLAFWRVEVGAHRVVSAGTSEGVTLALNRWLETALGGDDNLCASWLWAHNRWRTQEKPEKRFRLEAKRNLLAADLAARGLTVPLRRTRIVVRLPNWLGDVVMALPLLRALRVSRPDAELTFIAKKQFLPLLETWAIADRLQPLPAASGLAYFASFWRQRRDYPDVWLLFTNSFRGDLEAWLSGCRQRFGLVRPGKRRPLLSHVYRVPADFDERTHHQLELWKNFLNHFGLATAADRTPFAPFYSAAPSPLTNPHCHPSDDNEAGSSNSGKTGCHLIDDNKHGAGREGERRAAGKVACEADRRGAAVIGLICGSENNPEKRWPVAHWRALIEGLPGERFVLFGTAKDLPLTTAVGAGFEAARIENLAGRTSLPVYCERLRACRLLVTNDTGGMHLANALGVPLLALFGPTNPVRTGPIFSSPARIIQPPGCPPTGGGALADLSPQRVADAVRDLLSNTAE